MRASVIAVMLTLLTACDAPDPFRPVQNQAQSASILSPKDGAVIGLGAPLGFGASRFGGEPGPVWTSDRDGHIGSGWAFHNETLTLGRHVITASYPGGHLATITITIAPPLWIDSPKDGAVIASGTPLGFRATTPPGGPGPLSAGPGPRWVSDRDGEIGLSWEFHNESLSVGQHVITATLSAVETDTVTITIAPEL